MTDNLEDDDDLPVEPEREIAARLAWLRTNVPKAQLAAAGLVGTTPSFAQQIASAAAGVVSENPLESTTALNVARSFMAERDASKWGDIGPQGLLLCGPPGTGKTVAAMYIVACSHMPISATPPPGRPVEHYVVSALAVSAYNAGRGAMHKFNRAPETFQRMKNARVLVIDDLGQEDEDIACALRECLDARKSHRSHITVITTNLTKNVLLSRYGDAVGDRMREMFIRAEINEGSYRQPGPGW